MKLRHVVSYGRKTQINRIQEVLKLAVKFPSCVHLTCSQVGDCFSLQINTTLNSFKAVYVVPWMDERVRML